jgi:hypothetical protein
MNQYERAIKRLTEHTQYCVPPDDLHALNLAIDALCAQHEQMNPEPLTMEELRERHGKPVWIQEIEEPKMSCWRLCYWDRGKYLILLGMTQTGHLREEYGITWLAYDHEPALR